MTSCSISAKSPAGPTYRISTRNVGEAEEGRIVVKTYAEVLHDYRHHPEHKFGDIYGRACSRFTAGVLRRRPLNVAQVHHIGKEAKPIEDVAAGLVANPQTLYPRTR